MGEDYKSNQALAVLHLTKEESTQQTSDYDALSDQHECSSPESIDQKPSEESDNDLQDPKIEGVLQSLFLVIQRDMLKHLLCVEDDRVDA